MCVDSYTGVHQVKSSVAVKLQRSFLLFTFYFSLTPYTLPRASINARATNTGAICRRYSPLA